MRLRSCLDAPQFWRALRWRSDCRRSFCRRERLSDPSLAPCCGPEEDDDALRSQKEQLVAEECPMWLVNRSCSRRARAWGAPGCWRQFVMSKANSLFFTRRTGLCSHAEAALPRFSDSRLRYYAPEAGARHSPAPRPGSCGAGTKMVFRSLAIAERIAGQSRYHPHLPPEHSPLLWMPAASPAAAAGLGDRRPRQLAAHYAARAASFSSRIWRAPGHRACRPWPVRQIAERRGEDVGRVAPLRLPGRL